MEVSRLFWVGEVVLPVLWLWHLQAPADIVFWINVHTYASQSDLSHACSVSSSVHSWLVPRGPQHTKKILYTNRVQFIKEILATSALGNKFGLTHK